jgi:hypothetical protein
MLRKRTIALIVLLLTIIVACLGVRISNTGNQNLLKEPIENRDNVIISEPTPPSQTDITEPTPKPGNPTRPLPNPVAPPKKHTSSCYVGGCSSQLCTDNNDIASTCEWRESYACFRTATCERQASGECGWTETPELKSCIMETDQDQNIQVR